jgi:N6-adenosine-specific RNA methylase IME4
MILLALHEIGCETPIYCGAMFLKKYTMELRIKEEFKKLIPPLTAEEFKQLETNCIDEGIRDAIVTWQGFIIDGHNRYKIATDWQLSFKTIEKAFDSEYHVIEWMLVNQFGRRNLTETQKSYLRGVRQRNEAKRQGIRTDLSQNLGKVNTNEKLAKEYNVSKNTILNDAQFSRGVDLISKVAPEKHDEILLEKTELTKQEIQDFSKIEKVLEKQLKSEQIFISEDELNAKVEAKAKEKLKELEDQKKAAKEAKFIELQQKKEQYIERVETKNINEFKVDIFNTTEKFRVIYADPAWSYNDKQETPMLGGASKHYNTMSVSEICSLPVKDISEKDAILFLWVTSPLLEDAFTVIKSWGFKYKTSFVWDKIKHNMGHYNSVRHEFLLIATKGSCVPDNKKLYDSVQSIERNDNHSEKPIEFLDIIDDLYLYGNKLEMFCRNIKKQNWYGWGNEL